VPNVTGPTGTGNGHADVAVDVQKTCSHQWTHPSEPCPYCRETGAGTTASVHRIVDPERARRAERLSEAITATIAGDASRVKEWFTHDVVGSGPVLAVRSRDELVTDIEARDGTFVDVEIAFAPLDVEGAQACVEWVASARHAGPLVLDGREDRLVMPTGRRVRLRAVTVAEFEGDRICAFRSYWDDLRLLQELEDAEAG
jgi:ketosteroid isomerase-like protein